VPLAGLRDATERGAQVLWGRCWEWDDGAWRWLRLIDRQVTTTGAILAIYIPEE
jgi:hypothetical protein